MSRENSKVGPYLRVAGGHKEGVLGRSIRETEQVGYLCKIYYKAVHLLQSNSEVCRAGRQEGQAGILQHG